jgi:putative endonuclease
VISVLYRLGDALRRRARGCSPAAEGVLGEDAAHRFLRGHGCTVVARNYRPSSGAGEIDLVVWDGPVLVFVEVKTRATGDFGTPDRAVDADKQRFLSRVAHQYALRAGVDWEKVRFDIVAVTLGPALRVEWLKDAFRPPRT